MAGKADVDSNGLTGVPLGRFADVRRGYPVRLPFCVLPAAVKLSAGGVSDGACLEGSCASGAASPSDLAARHPVSHTATAMGEEAAKSDETLMSAFRSGDAGAFELLYSRHRGGLYRFLLRQCGVAAVAEELFQDVWMSLIRAKSRYVPQARFATYLYRIAHNKVIDHFRRSAHRPSLPDQGADDVDPTDLLVADPREQPDVRLETKAQIERFSVLLQALPHDQREAFVMREEGGLSLAEIAIATGVSEETAKSRLRYAVAKLRRGLVELM